MQVARNDLGLSHLYVIYSGKGSYPFAENISVVALSDTENSYDFN